MSLKHAITEYAHIALQSPKVAANVGLGTMLAATFREWIDGIVSYLGTSAIAIGAILSLVLIYNNIRGGIVRRRLARSENELVQMQKAKVKAELEALGRPWVDR